MQNVTDKKFLQELGTHIKKLRLQRGFSQLELAVRMDNYAEQIGRIERGQLNVTICTLKNIAGALGIPLYKLLEF